MAKVTIYLPDDLAARVKTAGIAVSSVCQRALQGVGRAVANERVRPCKACGVPGDYWHADSAKCTACGNCAYCGTSSQGCRGQSHKLTDAELRYTERLIATGFPVTFGPRTNGRA